MFCYALLNFRIVGSHSEVVRMVSIGDEWCFMTFKRVRVPAYYPTKHDVVTLEPTNARTALLNCDEIGSFHSSPLSTEPQGSKGIHLCQWPDDNNHENDSELSSVDNLS